MWPFKKKKPPVLQNTLQTCSHKYREFPWYKEVSLSISYQNDQGEDCGTMTVKIYKPYVCIHCKHRKDILLDEINRIHISWSEVLKFSKNLEEDYPNRFEPQAVVENMIADFQLIDREYLKMAHELFPDRGILTEDQND